MNLFTYGSLMFPQVWQRVTGLTGPSFPACLRHFATRRLRGQSYPVLVPCPSAMTHGALYPKISSETMALLDAFEGDFYQRTEVLLTLTDNRQLPAWVYLASRPEDPRILAELWDAGAFAQEELAAFLKDDPGFSGKR